MKSSWRAIEHNNRYTATSLWYIKVSLMKQIRRQSSRFAQILSLLLLVRQGTETMMSLSFRCETSCIIFVIYIINNKCSASSSPAAPLGISEVYDLNEATFNNYIESIDMVNLLAKYPRWRLPAISTNLLIDSTKYLDSEENECGWMMEVCDVALLQQ